MSGQRVGSLAGQKLKFWGHEKFQGLGESGADHSFSSGVRRNSVWCVCSVTESCLTLTDPIDCSPPGSSVHGISQARILEWVAISFCRGSSRPRD